jgi:hypothetical protein
VQDELPQGTGETHTKIVFENQYKKACKINFMEILDK